MTDQTYTFIVNEDGHIIGWKLTDPDTKFRIEVGGSLTASSITANQIECGDNDRCRFGEGK